MSATEGSSNQSKPERVAALHAERSDPVDLAARTAAPGQGNPEAHGKRSIEALRQRLLDLKTSNTQLNMRLGRSYVRVIDEIPEQIFDALCAGRSFEFAPVSKPKPTEGDKRAPDVVEAARAVGLDPSYELREPTASPARKHSDNFIQTLLFPDDLDGVLERLRRRAKTLLEELGVPTLHIVFGSLEWFDSDSSDRAMLAPLVLVQVELRRELKHGHYRYFIGGSSDIEPRTNDTLRLKLRRDFSMELPDLREQQPELRSYLEAVADLVREKDRWRVRRQVALGVFRFERLVMYQDLAADDWSPNEHPLLQRLLAMTADSSPPPGEPQDLDAPEFEMRAPLLVTDADASQTVAIADALAGHNLVVRGPPGTGKSQTITNLIAAALAQGKSVLFIAEKMAALDVVRKRLVDAQLGHFALDLHSTKASKREVLSHLEKRLVLPSEPNSAEVYERSRAQLCQVRTSLNDYLRAVHAPFGAVEASLFEILWRQEHLRPALDSPWYAPLSQVRVVGVLELTAEELRTEAEKLRLYQIRRAAVRQTARYGHHPWFSVLERGDLDIGSDDALVSSVRLWLEKLRALDACWGMLTHDHPRTVPTLSRIAPVAAALERPDAGVLALADALQKPALRAGAQRVLPAATRLSELDRLVQSVKLPPSHLERCCAEVRSVIGIASAFELGAPTLSHLATVFEGEVRIQHEAEAVAAAIRHAFPMLGWPVGDVEPSLIPAILQLADLVEQTSRPVLLVRSGPVLEERIPGVIDATITRIRKVRTLVAAVDEWASGWRTTDAEALRTAVLTLRDASFWEQLFGRDYKDARRRVRALLRGAKGSPEELAARAERCAEVLEEVRYLEGDPLLCALLPTGTDWQTADLDLILTAVRWGDDVRRATADLTAAASLVRVAAFQASTDTLIAISDIARRLRDLLTRWKPMSWTDGDLGKVAANKRAQAELGLVGVRSLLGKGLDPEAALQTLGAIATLAADREADARIIAAEAQVAAALGQRRTTLCERPGELDRALAWMDSVESWATQIGLRHPAGEPWSSWCDRVKSWGETTTTAAAEEEFARDRAESVGISVGRALEAAEGDLPRIIALLSATLASEGTLRDWIGYLRAWHEAQQFRRLLPVVQVVESIDDDLVGLEKGYEWLVYRDLTIQAQRRYPAMCSEAWSGEQLAEVRARFAQLDREILKTQQEEIQTRLLKRHVPYGNHVGPVGDRTDLALVRHEVAKQKRHIPIRQLMGRAHGAVLALTPCLMMSPLSVAQFLPRIPGMFDLLIVDEASQMRPEDAVCALARAKQAVVVGDEKQLPPTSFFDSSNDECMEDDERVDQRLDSILDWSRSSFSHARELLWHYRSRHESLIAFSNDRFYDGRLLVFPSPSIPGEKVGVRLHSVQRGTYNASLNEQEARAVVDGVIAFMRDEPSRTLGVVAMNRPQAELIERLLDEEIRRRGDDTYRERWADTLSPFFVKNLESVQGDERDVMFVSLTYGPPTPGAIVPRRFGPVNGEDGHRRLNVLFTRAREQITVFSSMKPGDIRVDETSSLGVRILRDYIEYAANAGRLTTNRPNRDRAGYDSPFEESVAALLNAEGFDTEPQVGVQGFFIDLGVRHYSHTSGFICGVECDGAAYHSTRSARDRDRIRQAVLEGLGWKIVRVWSTDWFHNPARARARLVRQVYETLEASTTRSG